METRKAQRLPEYDYARAGAYFVTVCCRPRLPLLGTVRGGDVVLSACGELVADDLRGLAARRPGVGVDLFVVMPDHVHAIVVSRGGVPLPAVVGGFKSGTARAINRLRGTPGGPVWQRGYHEHVVRDDADMDRVREYVATNPIRWELRRRR